VAIIEVVDFEAIARIVTEQISTVPGLQLTNTLTAFRTYSKQDIEQAWDIGIE
ncbi:MAG: Lrp/AsnC family transcriptional regulator, partial [Gemmatimonadaceae bacterium]|nr:Lrp/AsnC family transcriptional regulator [Gemmatimonadaceae bacterium]